MTVSFEFERLHAYARIWPNLKLCLSDEYSRATTRLISLSESLIVHARQYDRRIAPDDYTQIELTHMRRQS